MAEHFSFFDAVLQDDGVTYDREYNAQQFTKYFGALVTTGVMKGTGNMLAVSANGSNMVTKIDTGIAFVEAKYYENDSFLELTHDTETLGKDRIDRIVIRMDLSTEARYVKSFIKKGVPSTNPVPPTLTQTPNQYEISLAQVRIVGGQTFIATNAVTDERGKDVICPWAGSNILPSFDDNALAEHLVEMASKTQYGHVKVGTGINVTDGVISAALNNTLTSTSTTEAATANSVKQVNDKFKLPAPTNAVLAAGWANVDNANPLRYYKDAMGIVYLYGAIKMTSTTAGYDFMTLPNGFRPLKNRSVIALNGITKFANIEISSGGGVATFIEKVVGNAIVVDVSFPTTIN